MKFAYWMCGALAFCLCACSQSKSNSTVPVIDVVEAASRPAELKASMLGKTITYIPLETTDSTLIGGNCKIEVVGNKVIAANGAQGFVIAGGNGGGRPVMAFDLETGKFDAFIGSIGQGPGEYIVPTFKLGADGRTMMFPSADFSSYELYDAGGKYLGVIRSGSKRGTSTSVVGYRDSVVYTLIQDRNDESRMMELRRSTPEGEGIDSVKIFEGQSASPLELNFSGSMRLYNRRSALGSQTIAYIEDKNETTVMVGVEVSVGKDRISLHETLCDTIFTITPEGAEPALVFNMGEHSYPYTRLNSEPIRENHWFLTDVMEGGDKIIFGVLQGWDRESSTPIGGVYDKSTGKVVAGDISDGFADDLSGFMPLKPLLVTPDGAVIAMLTAEQILDWMEEHPEAALPESLAGLEAEDNPVIVVIR